jgi:hypothetical protein
VPLVFNDDALMVDQGLTLQLDFPPDLIIRGYETPRLQEHKRLFDIFRLEEWI